MSWRAHENVMSDGLTEEFGEPIRHQPMLRAPNERAIVDPSRPVQSQVAPGKPLKGMFEQPYKDSFISKGEDSTRAPPAAHSSSRNPTLSIEMRDLTSEVQAGDWFALLDRLEVYEVLDPKPDGTGRVVLQLVQIGRHNVNFKL